MRNTTALTTQCKRIQTTTWTQQHTSWCQAAFGTEDRYHVGSQQGHHFCTPVQYKNGINFNHAHGHFCKSKTQSCNASLRRRLCACVLSQSDIAPIYTWLRRMTATENRRKSYLGVMKVSRKLHNQFGAWGPVQRGEGCGLCGFGFSVQPFKVLNAKRWMGPKNSDSA